MTPAQVIRAVRAECDRRQLPVPQDTLEFFAVKERRDVADILRILGITPRCPACAALADQAWSI